MHYKLKLVTSPISYSLNQCVLSRKKQYVDVNYKKIISLLSPKLEFSSSLLCSMHLLFFCNSLFSFVLPLVFVLDSFYVYCIKFHFWVYLKKLLRLCQVRLTLILFLKYLQCSQKIVWYLPLTNCLWNFQ